MKQEGEETQCVLWEAHVDTVGMRKMHYELADTILAGEASGSCIPEHVSPSRKWGRAQQPQPRPLGTQPWI